MRRKGGVVYTLPFFLHILEGLLKTYDGRTLYG